MRKWQRWTDGPKFWSESTLDSIEMESSPDAITSSEEDVQPTRREETSFIYNEDTKAAELKNDKGLKNVKTLYQV